jgi:O-succinylbenzoic acid--CoA ligase
MERVELARRLGAADRGFEPRDVVIAERDARRFMTVFGEAVAAGGTVFVADPSWGEAERAQFAAVTNPEALNPELRTLNREPARSTGWLCLPTGGSSGSLKLARHDQETIGVAVRGCGEHFQARRINAIGVLPLHHVSGLMAWMRCALTGGQYLPWTWVDLENGRWPETGKGDWFLSLVPTQLQRLLGQRGAEERLRRLRAVFLGGGPAWPELLERAAEARLPLAPGYGMTETAAMVTSLRPREFLGGHRGCGLALPHARVDLGVDGVIEITAESLFRGYYPGWREPGRWQTEDLGRFDGSGSLQVLGRRDAIIITGGEKVDSGEVEAVLRATGQFADVAVVGVPDAEWGEAIVACYPAGQASPDVGAVAEQIAAQLAPAKRPKHYVSVANWPRNDQGKVNRAALRDSVERARGRGRIQAGDAEPV